MTGSYSVLVVRVSDTAGHSPTYSARQISNSIFNGNVSMANGYRTCSNNQLNFYQARGGSDVKNGVVDIVVFQDLSGAYDSNICVNAADAALSSSSAYDVGNSHSYTMYICPDVVEFGSAAGVAQMGGRKSWFSDGWASYPFVQMHEIGHNLMFFHSSEGKLEYGDPTGIMGGSYEHSQDWGKMCFNAAQTHHSGWYSQSVLSSEEPSKVPSMGLSVRQSLSPSSQPSLSPSVLPSEDPSQIPSKIPSVSPSGQPSSGPTMLPSEEPSQFPLIEPSVRPSQSPLAQPSSGPTMLPSKEPSQVPSMGPTVRPSQSPLVQPSSGPTVLLSDESSQVPSMGPTVRPSLYPTAQLSEGTNWNT